MSYKKQSKVHQRISGLKPFRPSELFGGKIYVLDLKRDGLEEQITIFFITNQDGMFYELGLRNFAGNTTFFNINGKVVEYNREDRKPRIIEKEKKDSESVDCGKVGARVTAMTGNSALGGCVEAMCHALQCRTFGDCGEQTLLEWENLEKAVCLTYYNGQMRVWNETE